MMAFTKLNFWFGKALDCSFCIKSDDPLPLPPSSPSPFYHPLLHNKKGAHGMERCTITCRNTCQAAARVCKSRVYRPGRQSVPVYIVHFSSASVDFPGTGNSLKTLEYTK